MICPICNGHGETERERRIYRYGLNWWWEYGCRACAATGRTTNEWLVIYHAAREREALTAWEQAERKREVQEREGELAEMEKELEAA